MPVLSKHAVLSGPVDFCCLPCERCFRSRTEAEQHVDSEPHTTSFAATAYSEKFADEDIRKIRQLFYCEACDTVIPSSRKVQGHVADEEHQFNKENGEPLNVSSLFRRVGDEVIASDSILLSSAAWNGIVEESCAVCDCDWEQLDAHLADVKHVVNLILAKVQSGIGDTIFRKIDNAQFQCLTCNAVLPQAEFVSHGDTRDHQRQHIQCRKAKRALDESKRTVDESKRTVDESKTVYESKRMVDESKRTVDESKRTLDKSKRTLDEATHKQDEKSAGDENKNTAENNKNIGTKVDKYKDSTTLTESQKQHTEKESNNQIIVGISDNDKSAKINDTDKESEKKDCKSKADQIDSNEVVKEVIKIRMEPEPPVNELLYDDLNTELELNSYMLNTLAGRVLCVLCNWEFEMFNYKMHLNMEHHKILESMHREEVKRLNESKIKGKNGFSKDKQMIYNTVDQLKKDHITANFVKDKADCDRCKAVLPLELDRIVEHIESHKRAEREKEEAAAKKKKEREEAEAKEKMEKDAAKEKARNQQEEYYKENKITVKDRQAICTVCHVEMSNIKKCINEHINGARHKRNTEKTPVDESDYESYDSSSDESECFDSMKKVRMDKFVVLFKTAEDVKFCLVNNAICLSMASYNLASLEDNCCLLCEKQFSSNPYLINHSKDYDHMCKMAALPVVTELKQELVRMVKPNVFHCGICHEQIHSWKTLMHHIRHSKDHQKGRIVCSLAMMTLRPDARVTANTLKFIAKVNEANGRTYFNSPITSK